MDAGGLVFATISNACGSSSDTISVTLLDAIPALDLGSDQSLCPGETITIDPGIPDVEYLWTLSTGAVSTGSTIAVDSPVIVILTISNDCGASSDTIEIVLDPTDRRSISVRMCWHVKEIRLYWMLGYQAWIICGMTEP